MGFFRKCQNCRPELEYDALKAMLHYRHSPYHHYCHVCNKHLSSRRDLIIHAGKHHADSHCSPCHYIFYDKVGLHNHLAVSANHPNYCADCKIEFSNNDNYLQHRLSATHQVADKPCGLPGCDRKFISAAAILLHWEGGACSSGIDVVDVYRLALKGDHDHEISITHPDQEHANEPINEAMARKYTARRGQFLCLDHQCSATFATAYASMQHFNARHASDVFKCPNRNCHLDARFSSLSAVAQHVRSGTCDADNGYAGRMAVIKAMKAIKTHYLHPRSGRDERVAHTGYAHVVASLFPVRS